MKRMIDIHSDWEYPSRRLSNFAPNRFVFDGVMCESMEGLLQAFKFQDSRAQHRIVGLTALDAKLAGRAGNGWRKTQRLYWMGEGFDRHSQQYQLLLDRAFHALAENPDFQAALLASGPARLEHSIGCDDPNKTILTRKEFVDRLTAIRTVLQQRRAC